MGFTVYLYDIPVKQKNTYLVENRKIIRREA